MNFEYHGPINPNPFPPDGESRISIYLYHPWLGGAIAGAVLFGIIMVIQLFYMARSKGIRWFHGLLAFGSLMEVAGYGLRVKGHQNMFLVMIFVVQYFLIVVAPIPIAAAVYLVISYAAKRFPGGRQLLLISPNLIVILLMPVFVVMDCVTIAIQVVGAAMVGVVQIKTSQGLKPPMTSQQAGNILLAGLAVQTGFFSIFLCLLGTAIMRTKRLALDADMMRKLHSVLYITLAAALLVLLRTVYRLAVECQGYFGSANSSQTLFTCLEFLPVVIAMAIFSAVPMARFFPSREAIVSNNSYELDKDVGGSRDTY